MQENTQQPDPVDIGHSETSTSEDVPVRAAPADPKASGRSRSGKDVRRPLAPAGHHLVPLFLSGLIATVMVVAFAAGFESIFPSPASATVPDTSEKATAPAVEEGTQKAAPVKPPETSVPTDTATPDPEPSTEADPAKSTTEDTTSRREGGRPVGLLASLLPIPDDASPGTSSEARGPDGPGPFGRLVVFLKFAILILLGVGCGLVALGGMALMLDRPLGSVLTAASRMLAAGWLSTLALLVPAPYTWMLDPLHYLLAGAIFCGSMIVFFRFSVQQAITMLGATMALLATTAFGSWVVIWAAWS